MVFVTRIQDGEIRLLGSGLGSASKVPSPLIAHSRSLGKGQRQGDRGL